MEWLGRLLFPTNPKMVRYRKVRLLLFTIFLSVLSCVLVGLLVFLMGRSGY
jgi:hypothetical protein